MKKGCIVSGMFLIAATASCDRGGGLRVPSTGGSIKPNGGLLGADAATQQDIPAMGDVASPVLPDAPIGVNVDALANRTAPDRVALPDSPLDTIGSGVPNRRPDGAIRIAVDSPASGGFGAPDTRRDTALDRLPDGRADADRPVVLVSADTAAVGRVPGRSFGDAAGDTGNDVPMAAVYDGPRSDGAPFADGSADGATDSAQLSWQGREMVGRPTDHSAIIKAIAGQAVEAYVDLGTTSGAYTSSTSATTYSNGIIEAVADGLDPDTRYYYRLRYRLAGSTAAFDAGGEYTFVTQRARGAGFTFAIQSDSHLGTPAFNNPSLYQLTMQNIAVASPDFLLDLGDAISMDNTSETEATARTKYLAQRAYFEIPGHSAAIFMVLGNHEREEGWKLDDFGSNVAASYPVLSANARKRYFVNPVPDTFYSGNTDPMPELDGDQLRGDYYAFEWGNALFVGIDPFWYTMKKPYAGNIGGGTSNPNDVIGTRWDWTLGEQQYQWLKQTLENSSAPLKFVFSHQMVGGIEDYGRGGALAAKFCEFGGYDVDGTTWSFDSNRSGWATPIHQLFVQNHVTAYFHGHDHVYAKEVLDGIVYQEVPMAANSGYDTGFSTNATEYKGATLIANSGYIRVTVSSTGATVEYVRSFLSAQDGTNNSVADSYTLQGFTPAAVDGGTGG